MMTPIRLVPAHEVPWRNAFLALFGALLTGTIAWPILFMIGIAMDSGNLLLFTLALGAILTIAWSVAISPALLFAWVLTYIPGAGRIVTGIGTAGVFLVTSTTLAWVFGFAQKPSMLATYTVVTIVVACLLILFGEESTFVWIREFFFKRLAVLWCLLTLLGPAYMIIGDIPLAMRDRARVNAARTAANIRKGEMQRIAYTTRADLGKIQFFDSELLDGQTEPRPLVWKGCADPTTGLVRLFYNGEGRVDGNCGKMLTSTGPDDPELLAGITTYQQKLAEEAAQKAAAQPTAQPSVEATPEPTATPSPPPTPQPTAEPMTTAQVLAQARELRERERKRQEAAYGVPTTTLPTWYRATPTPTPVPTREPDYIKEGTELVIAVNEGFSLSANERVTPFSCIARTDVRSVYGTIVIAKGAPCHGRVERVWKDREDGNIYAALSIMEIADISVSGEEIAAQVNARGQNTKKRAVVGGIIGGIVGGAAGAVIDGERGAKRGAAGGAVAGAGTGAATSRGAHIKSGAEITFSFWRDVFF
ncbi:MAG: hypothetical protein AAB608_01410 [Patescibacteria group bacterium]